MSDECLKSLPNVTYQDENQVRQSKALFTCTLYYCIIRILPLIKDCKAIITQLKLIIPQVHVILGVYCYVAYLEVKEESQGPAPVSQLKKAD